jgi:hypothetical protein
MPLPHALNRLPVTPAITSADLGRNARRHLGHALVATREQCRKAPPGHCAAGTRGLQTTRSVVVVTRRGLGHLHQELDVGTRLAQPVEQEVDGLLRVQGMQHPAQLEHDRKLIR